MPNVRELVLYYYPGPEAAKAKGVFLQQRVRMIPVEPAQFGRTVGVLSGLRQEAGPEPTEEAELPDSPVLVFSGLSDRRLDAVLTALRRAGVPRSVFKAVVTPDNLDWTFGALCAELARERAAVEPSP